MALSKQSVSISFNKGLDTKTDSKQLIPGKLLTLENVILKKVGKFVKRPGYGVIAAAAPISNGNALATFKNELLAFDGSTISSYSSSDDKLYQKGTKVAVDLAVQSIARNSYEQTAPDCAVHSVGISVYAWQDSSGGVRYSVFDNTTQHSIVSNELVSATGSKPKVKTIGSNILIFFVDGTSLKYFRLSSANPSLTYPVVTLVTLNSYYDVSFINSKLYVAFSTGTTTGVFSLDSALVQSGTTTVSEVSSCLSVFGDTSNNVWVAYNSGNNLKVFIRDSALTGVVLAPTVIEAGSAPFVNVAGIYDTTGKIWYEVTGDISSNQYVKFNTCTISGTVGTPSVFLRSVGLYSKPFLNGSSVYVTVTHDSDLQPTYFIVNGSGSVVTKLAPSLGGGLSNTGLLAEVNTVSNNNYLMAYEFKDFVQSVSGDVTTQTGVNAGTLTFSAPILTAELGNNLHVSGGIVSAYDGQSINELGFNLYPEEINIGSAIYGGNLQPQKYQYLCVYEWTDSQGQIHKSAPSIPKDLDATDLIFLAQGQITLVSAGYSFQSASTTTFEDFLYLFPGMKLSGLSASANATLIYNRNYLGNFTAGSIPTFTVYNQTTTSAAGQYKLSPGFSVQAVTQEYSDILTIKRQIAEYLQLDCIQGSNILTLRTEVQVKIGSKILLYTNSPTPSVLATVLSQNGKTITIDLNAPYTRNNIFAKITYPAISVSAVSSSPTVTTADTSVFNVGEKWTYLDTSDNENPATVISKTLTTVTFNKNSNTTGTKTLRYTHEPFYPEVGMTFFDTKGAFSGQVVVEEVDKTNGTIKVNQKSTKTQGYSDPTDIISTESVSSSLQIETLRITDKKDVVITVYRTAANGTLFYKVSSFQQALYNDKTKDYVLFIDTAPDNKIIGNEQLYTTGGEVENIAVPASNLIATYRNRVIAVPNEDPISFWYSKQTRTNTPIEFNDSFIQRVPEKGGSITGLQQMDDKLLIFKQDYIFVMVGDGPSVSGINNDFTDPQLITADAGCSDKKSIVVLPTGVIFKSQKGFYLLDRALNVKYIGADVESFNSAAVNSAKMVETENQVRFNLSTGDTLVYDYYLEQWNIFKSINGVDAVNFQDRYTYLLPNGQIRRETPNAYLDDTSLIPIKIETGWISLAGLQGFQRIYQFLILGTYKSPHTLVMELYKDYIETPYQTTTIPVLTAPDKYQFRVYPSIQKCEAFKIKITEQQIAPFGEGCDITGIALEAGAKAGQNKLSSAKSYG